MELIDVFVFVEDFNPKLVGFFIEKYLTGFESDEMYFECPKYGKKVDFETESYEEMLAYVLEVKGRSYTFFLSKKDDTNVVNYSEAIIQINSDGSICLALCCKSNFEKMVCNDLKNVFSRHNIYVSYNSALPLSKKSLTNTTPTDV